MLPLPPGEDEKKQEKYIMWGLTLCVISEVIGHARDGKGLAPPHADGSPVIFGVDWWYDNPWAWCCFGKATFST